MLTLLQDWIKRLHLNQVYGQLILLMLLPAVLLSTVGLWLTYHEIKKNYLITQRAIAQSILNQHRIEIDYILKNQSIQSSQQTLAIQQQLQQILLEKDVESVILYQSTQSVYQLGKNIELTQIINDLTNTSQTQIMHAFKMEHYQVFAVSITEHKNTWLILALDQNGLSMALYRMIAILVLIVLISLGLLFAALNLYARYWLSPIYKIRLQLQQLTVHNLEHYQMIKSSGELKQLQQDIYYFIQDLNQQFQELKHYAEETENDTRQMLDRIEIESANYQRELKTIKNLNQSKSLFLANVSHELRTPLNSIEGFIQLLLRQKNISTEQKIYLETIKKSSAHLLALINDILDYSKIEAGKLQLDEQPFHLESAIYDVMDMLSPLASQKNLDLVFYYPADLFDHVIGDELRFKQILMNLMSNAIKFTLEGEIIVRVRLEKQIDTHHLFYFSVQDSGIGLSGTDKNKLFESFSQADSSIIRQYGGTGLGLAISKQLVYMMNGKIGFMENQSQTPTEKGTTFWFTALFKIDSSITVTTKKYQKPLKILSYLHRPAMASVLRYYLEEEYIQHDEAHSAFDLLHQLHEMQNNPPDWVFIDEQNDLEASLKEIRQRYQGRLTVCGYQMSLNMNLLKEYHACVLYQPIYRTALWKLFDGEYFQPEDDIEFDGQDLHILAVDDHLPNLMVLDALLQELNIHVIQANSGQEAINIIQQRIEQQQPLFDLIFMDIQMPVMSGLDTVRAIRSLELALNQQEMIPIIALSAHILHDDHAKILASGMNDAISKPIRMEQLIYILQKWVNIHHQNKQTILSATTLTQQNQIVMQQQMDKDILDWTLSMQLTANKTDLAQDLLQMLIQSFDEICFTMQDLIDLEDFPALEPILHRLYGATRYVGTPKLQRMTGDFEQFVSQLRKEQRHADDEFITHINQRFIELKQVMEQVKDAVQQQFPN